MTWHFRVSFLESRGRFFLDILETRVRLQEAEHAAERAGDRPGLYFELRAWLYPSVGL